MPLVKLTKEGLLSFTIRVNAHFGATRSEEGLVLRSNLE